MSKKDLLFQAFKVIRNNTAADLPQCSGTEDYFNIEFKAGKGHFKILYFNLICKFSIADYKKVINMLVEDPNSYSKAIELNDLFKSLAKFLNKGYNYEEKTTNNANIKAEYTDSLNRLKKLNDVLVENFGVPSLEVKEPIKLKKDIAYKRVKNNELEIDYNAKSFIKFGYRWIISKDSKIRGRKHIIVPCCGLSCADFDGSEKQGIELITEELKNKVVEIVSKNSNQDFIELLKNNGIEKMPQFEVKDSIDLVNEVLEEVQDVTIEEFTEKVKWENDLLNEASKVNENLDYSDKIECFNLYFNDLTELIIKFNKCRGDSNFSDIDMAAFIMAIEFFNKIGKKTIDKMTIPDFSDLQDRIDNKEAWINTLNEEITEPQYSSIESNNTRISASVNRTNKEKSFEPIYMTFFRPDLQNIKLEYPLTLSSGPG